MHCVIYVRYILQKIISSRVYYVVNYISMKIYVCSDSLTGIFLCNKLLQCFKQFLLFKQKEPFYRLPLGHRDVSHCCIEKNKAWQSFTCLLQLFFSCAKHIALTLWDQLGDGTPQHHQKSVELFYQLHNLVPSSSICEDVISQQLTHRDKASC